MSAQEIDVTGELAARLAARVAQLEAAVVTACVLFEEAGRPQTAKALREIAYEDGER